MTKNGKPEMRIGIDLGGTKIEALAIDPRGVELMRHRVDTPHNYHETIDAIAGLVRRLESETGRTGTVGAGIPGTISGVTGLVKNANATWLNGKPLDKDLSAALGREARVANDANCLAVSEATDGAGAGRHVVFAVILGTGCGGGIAIDGQVHSGRNGVAGEWGHLTLGWQRPDEFPGPECFCGRRGCIELWVSGTGVARDYRQATGREKNAREIMSDFEAGDAAAIATVDRFEDRLARGLAQVVNIIDPDVIVLGGGLSQAKHLYTALPKKIEPYVFGREADVPILQAIHGDSSGVRGAAWLWPAEQRST